VESELVGHGLGVEDSEHLHEVCDYIGVFNSKSFKSLIYFHPFQPNIHLLLKVLFLVPQPLFLLLFPLIIPILRRNIEKVHSRNYIKILILRLNFKRNDFRRLLLNKRL